MSIVFATLMFNDIGDMLHFKNRGYITVQLERHNGLLMYKTKLGTSSYRLLIDTGSADNYIDISFIKSEDRDKVINGRITQFKIGNSAIKELTLLPINLDSVNNSYSQNNIPIIIGIIGAKSLIAMDAIVDCGRSRIYIKSINK